MWYVIQTMKGRERKVADEIIADIAYPGENVFVFENEMEYKVQGKWIKDRNPLFPGYLFVALEKEQAENFDIRLRHRKRPLKLMAVDGVITPIKPEEEEFLMQLGGAEHIIRHSEGFRVDDMVEITSGSFKGWRGEIVKLNRHKRRAKVRLSLMGRDIEADIGLSIVKNITFDELGSEEKINRMKMARVVG